MSLCAITSGYKLGLVQTLKLRLSMTVCFGGPGQIEENPTAIEVVSAMSAMTPLGMKPIDTVVTTVVWILGPP